MTKKNMLLYVENLKCQRNGNGRKKEILKSNSNIRCCDRKIDKYKVILTDKSLFYYCSELHSDFRDDFIFRISFLFILLTLIARHTSFEIMANNFDFIWG